MYTLSNTIRTHTPNSADDLSGGVEGTRKGVLMITEVPGFILTAAGEKEEEGGNEKQVNYVFHHVPPSIILWAFNEAR